MIFEHELQSILLIDRFAINNYSDIIDELYLKLYGIIKKGLPNKINKLDLPNYSLETDSFINSLSLLVNYGRNYECKSYFIYDEGNLILDDNHKLSNIKIYIDIKSEDFSYYSFLLLLTHELTKLSIFRELLLNNSFKENEKYYPLQYIIENVLSYNINTKIVVDNESLYNYLLTHKNIEECNIAEHFRTFPSVDDYLEMSKLLEGLNYNIEKNKDSVYNTISHNVLIAKQKIAYIITNNLIDYYESFKKENEKAKSAKGIVEYTDDFNDDNSLFKLFIKERIIEKIVNKKFITIL